MSRYGRGEDYLNCPLNKDEYDAFVHALQTADTVPVKGFEEKAVFEGCMPIESLAKRGEKAIAFGPLKTRRADRSAYRKTPLCRRTAAAGQFSPLRCIIWLASKHGLTFPEQRRVFRMIPGLENADFARMGVMHRNTFLNSPGFLDDTYRVINNPRLYFAGADHGGGRVRGKRRKRAARRAVYGVPHARCGAAAFFRAKPPSARWDGMWPRPTKGFSR